jgi:CRP/FNR family transcriptional regulator, cyclic AMP receptor protein
MVKADAAERFLTAPLLLDVDPDARRAVLEILTERRASSGAVLLEQGQPNGSLSFLIEGTATVERTQSDGHKDVLAQLAAPSVFGTVSFFLRDTPTVTVRASGEVCVLTLDHPTHDRLRRDNPRAAEALALAALRTLAERFNVIDKRLSDSLAQHAHDAPKVNEWSGFRARLFEETNM